MLSASIIWARWIHFFFSLFRCSLSFFFVFLIVHVVLDGRSGRRVQRSHCAQSQCPISAFISHVQLLLLWMFWASCKWLDIHPMISKAMKCSYTMCVCVCLVTNALLHPHSFYIDARCAAPLKISWWPQNVVASVLSNSKEVCQTISSKIK